MPTDYTTALVGIQESTPEDFATIKARLDVQGAEPLTESSFTFETEDGAETVKEQLTHGTAARVVVYKIRFMEENRN